MNRIALSVFLVCMFAAKARAQNREVKFIADTLIVEADGTYEADPDLATLAFDISSQDKELKPTYEKAAQAIQKIVELAGRNGVKKEDISSGVLTVTPFYGGDRRKRANSFLVRGHVILSVRDFSKLGSILEESVTDEITDFRSLTYSLADEEAAKQRAVAEAMKRSVGRATAALNQKGQKIGALRFANVDVKQLIGVAQISAVELNQSVQTGGGGIGDVFGLGMKKRAAPAPPPPPIPHPEKITVNATVQCAFQIL